MESDSLTKDIMIFQEYHDIINDLNNNKIKKLYDWCIKNKDILLKNAGDAITNKNKDETIEDNKDIYFECVKYNYILLLEDETKTVEDCVKYT